MQQLPIKHMTLYKHGVGFFERAATFTSDAVTLSFRLEEMNDLLKSLTVIDSGGGQVLGIDYATPQSREERLAGCSIRLADERSVQDLLVGLRGRRVRLRLDQGEEAMGTLVGPDAPPERQPLDSALVSVLLEDERQVAVVALSRISGVEILDEKGAADLRFFLETVLNQENYRTVTIRLTPGEHALRVCYIAPAPTWRVSYRLVGELQAEDAGEALLQGWGIFDNQLEEELHEISLSLVAGMPISFRYDLYHPFLPERPLVKEEARVAAGPVEMEAQLESMVGDAAEALPPAPGAMRAMRAPAPRREKIAVKDLQASAAVSTQGEALGELFQYVIETPVTVARGQSAMVPILSAVLPYEKHLLYNSSKLPVHPVATLRFANGSGLTLERGPVTVIEGGEYVGEAMIPFTGADGEVVVPYAVELGVKGQEETGSSREILSVRVVNQYLHFEEWELRWREYRFANQTAQSVTVLVEHPRERRYEIFDTPEPVETTAAHHRFAVKVPAHGEATLKVHTRRLMRRREELQRQSLRGLQRYLKQGLLDRAVTERLSKLLMLWESIDDYQKKLQEVAEERKRVYQAQEQIRKNMGALSQTGKEGSLRAQYVGQLKEREAQLRDLERREQDIKAEIARVEQDLETRLRALG